MFVAQMATMLLMSATFMHIQVRPAAMLLFLMGARAEGARWAVGTQLLPSSDEVCVGFW